MPDIILDSNVLADFLAQFFNEAERGQRNFRSRDRITDKCVFHINKIIASYNISGDLSSGLVIASSLAFVEIVRKWEVIVKKRFNIIQFAAFIEQPPEWFFIASIDEDLIDYILMTPTDIALPNGEIKPIEWTDAVHVSTVISRGNSCLIATTDQRIEQINILKNRII
jgi:hypothetical protein